MDDTINKKMKNVSLDKDNNIDIDPWTIVKSMLSQYDNKELIIDCLDSKEDNLDKEADLLLRIQMYLYEKQWTFDQDFIGTTIGNKFYYCDLIASEQKMV